ncbi:MAG TPA: TA system VapC family ribonuclease toxin [Rhizomicrobium sp.]|nr:TA system VapC family ribonuclease toxin [Rhizomicrobium sp.]
MILVDANVLLHAHMSSHDEHARMHAWLDGQLNGATRVGLPWESLLGFARIATNPRVYPRPQSSEGAWGQVRAWLGCRSTWIPKPTELHAELLGEMVELPGTTSKLVADAHLAALAIEHGLTLCSSDRDFGRFPKLRWFNPLAA